MEQSTLVSIIIPVYNVESYLSECLDSCLEQTYSNIEILAINDGSSDGSKIILEKYADKDSRIKVFHQLNNGVVVARNHGLRNANGTWIMFVDADDIIAQEAVELLLKSALENNVDICTGEYCELYDKYEQTYYLPCYGLIRKSDFYDFILSQKIQWGLCARIYKKELFIDNQSTNFRLGEDAALLIQLIQKSKSNLFINKVLYKYRVRSGSAVRSSKSEKLKDIYLFRCWISSFLNSNEFNNSELLNLFVLSGYIETVLAGGREYLSLDDYQNVQQKYLLCKQHLSLWQRLLFNTVHYPLINTALVCFLQGLIKFKLKVIRAYCHLTD